MDRRRLVFSKRFLDASWTPAFRNELAVAEFVHALSDDSRSRLEQYIVQNPQAVREFEAFRPKAIDFAMDLPLNVPGSVSKEDVEGVMHNTFADIGEGLTNDAVLRRIAESDLAGLAPKTIRNATLRFVCQDHELRDGEYVFREVQLLMA